MRLWLTPDQARALAQAAFNAAPEEACGLLAGTGEQVRAVIPIRNAADDPRRYYRLDDAVFVKALFDLERRGLALLGFYHSHPNGDPIPSPTDIRQAAYPDAAYLIIGLATREPRLAAWQISGGAVTPVELHISFDAPPPGEPASLSPAQKAAILLAGFLAVLLMIMLSLALLPPAPIIGSSLP